MNKSIPQNRLKERGQVVILVLLMMSIFMLGFVGLATDYTNLWFHRQAVQGAADATCQAGGMDLLLYAEGQATPKMNFVPTAGATINCASTPTAAPCIIAKRNGYNGAAAANSVVMTFPATVSGAPAKPPGVAVPYVQVDITEQVPMYFSRLLTGKSTAAVRASATCGLTAPAGPVPIVVLHPTAPQAIQMKGSQDSITVVGGPQRSLQVNSQQHAWRSIVGRRRSSPWRTKQDRRRLRRLWWAGQSAGRRYTSVPPAIGFIPRPPFPIPMRKSVPRPSLYQEPFGRRRKCLNAALPAPAASHTMVVPTQTAAMSILRGTMLPALR